MNTPTKKLTLVSVSFRGQLVSVFVSNGPTIDHRAINAFLSSLPFVPMRGDTFTIG